jgi:hypothetical protein
VYIEVRKVRGSIEIVVDIHNPASWDLRLLAPGGFFVLELRLLR